MNSKQAAKILKEEKAWESSERKREGLFDKVIDELKKSNATRLKTEEILKTIEEEARAEKAKTEESDKE